MRRRATKESALMWLMCGVCSILSIPKQTIQTKEAEVCAISAQPCLHSIGKNSSSLK